MTRRRLALVTAFLALSVLLLGAIDARRSSADGAERLTGSWFGTATATTVPLPPLKDLITFHE